MYDYYDFLNPSSCTPNFINEINQLIILIDKSYIFRMLLLCEEEKNVSHNLWNGFELDGSTEQS